MNAVAQTDDGYLWIGTEEGLARFNGVRFEVFDGLTEDVFASSHAIRALVSDGKSLWIATDGAGIIGFREGEFSLLQNALVEENIPVNSLLQSASGELIVGTDNQGLFKLSEDADLEEVPFFADRSIRGLSEGPDSTIFVGTDAGLYVLGHDDTIIPVGYFDIGQTEISSVFYDSLGRLWFGSRDSTYYVDSDENRIPVAASRALTFEEDKYGDIWIGLDGSGLLRFSDGNLESITTEQGLTHDKVVTLLEDDEGSIWVGTEGGGLGQLRRTPFLTYGIPEGMDSEMVLTVVPGNDGTVWAGTEGGGLYRIDPQATNPISKVPGTSDQIITSLATVSDDLLMIGTYFGGLWQLENGNLSKPSFHGKLPEGSIAAMSTSPDGTLWLGTDGGVVEVRDRGAYLNIIDTDDGLGSNYITAVHEDTTGRVWVGTYDAGLYLIETDGRVFPVEDELDDTILSIDEDASGNIWLSTLRNGLFVFDGDSWYGIDRTNGLPTTTIYQLVFDDQDGLWMTSNKGLMRTTWREALMAARADSVVQITLYGRDDGLRTSEFNGGVQPAGAIDSNGRLWMPGIRGLVEFHPETVLEPREAADVLVESIKTDGETLDIYSQSATHIELQPGTERVEIDVAAMTLTNGKNTRIEYMLYDFDTRWSEVNSGETITYTNLKPGDYILRIRTTVDSPGEMSFSKERHIVFVLEPRFYQYKMFWVMVAIVTIVMIVLLHRVRIRHIQRVEGARRMQLEKIVEERTEDLRTLNDQLEERVQLQVEFILSVREKYEKELVEAHGRARESERLKSTILRNLSHEFRTPITSIIGFAEIIAEKLDAEDQEFIEYIKESATRLSETLLVIVDMSELESRDVHVHDRQVELRDVVVDALDVYKKQIDDKGLKAILDIDESLSTVTDREILSKILSILINNAVKFTDSGSITLRAWEDSEKVSIAVKDTGIGIGEEFVPQLFSAFSQESSGHDRKYQGIGLGLTVASQLCTLLQGTITANSEAGVGSEFIVTLPQQRSKVTGEDREAIRHLSNRYPGAPTTTAGRSYPPLQ